MLYSKTVVTNIDYKDIYDNIDDYEYPYNHINRGVNKHINNNLNYQTYERF